MPRRAAFREAECHEALGERAATLAVYERLSKVNTAAPDEVLLRLGRAAKLTGNAEKARQAFGRLYYDFPLSDYALSAGAELDSGPLIGRFDALTRSGSVAPSGCSLPSATRRRGVNSTSSVPPRAAATASWSTSGSPSATTS